MPQTSPQSAGHSKTAWHSKAAGPSRTAPSHQTTPLQVAKPQSELAERINDLVDHWSQVRIHPALRVMGLLTVFLAGAGVWMMTQASPSSSLEDSIPFASPTTAQSSTPTVEVAPQVAGLLPVATAPSGQPSTGEPVQAAAVVVHVAGAVRRPGLVELNFGDRVDAAIEGAGGPKAKADIHRLNLAIVVEDGMQIIVPTVGEEIAGPFVVFGAGSFDEPQEATTAVLVDLNTADASTLQSLPGIGPALAAAIVEWRTLNGAFVSADDLVLVSGIGPAKLAALADFVTV